VIICVYSSYYGPPASPPASRNNRERGGAWSRDIGGGEDGNRTAVERNRNGNISGNHLYQRVEHGHDDAPRHRWEHTNLPGPPCGNHPPQGWLPAVSILRWQGGLGIRIAGRGVDGRAAEWMSLAAPRARGEERVVKGKELGELQDVEVR
jgi:hypothetical protein